MNGAKPINNKMFEAESKVVKQLSEDGSCIILGRCADYILRDKENVYSFYICANDKYREIRGKEIYEGKTLYELNEEDGKRGQYYQYYTGNKWGDPKNYNLIIDKLIDPVEAVLGCTVRINHPDGNIFDVRIGDNISHGHCQRIQPLYVQRGRLSIYE